MSKHLIEQFVTYYVALGEPSTRPLDPQFPVADPAQLRIHREADTLIRELRTKMSLKVGPDESWMGSVEVCEVEYDPEVVRGTLVWVSVWYSDSAIPQPILAETRNVVLAAYAQAASNAGPPDLVIRLIQVDAQNTYPVTETVTLEGL
jgi:hypothetical protein